MIITRIDTLGRIFTAPEVRSQLGRNGHDVSGENFRCPICNRRVAYRNDSDDSPGGIFAHVDGSPDCFESGSTSKAHQLATEITVKTLHNRIKEVTGESVELDVEKWIGIRRNFIIADIRITSPLQVGAEVFYKVETLALGRRLRTMFANQYQAYLIFHEGGSHNAERVENYIQRIAPLRIGRFDPESLEITLGDLFSKQNIEMTESNLDQVPDYIAR